MDINRIDKLDLHREKGSRSVKSTETLTLSCGETVKCYTIGDFDILTQVIGLGMHINENRCDVYLRGQTSLYKNKDGKVPMTPSLYRRGMNSKKRADALKRRIKDFLKETNLYNRIDTEEKLIPLLQHYGFKTDQIDVVDNLWVALWFATHKAESKTVGAHEYVHFYETDEEYCYLYLLATDADKKDPKSAGILKGKETTLVDLRKLLPSYFVRPHAQHAFMIKKNQYVADDYSDLIVSIIRIPSKKALEWIGRGAALSAGGLFPPVTHDPGYAVLLETVVVDSGKIKDYGSLQIITGL